MKLHQCDRCGAVGGETANRVVGEKTEYPHSPALEAWTVPLYWDLCLGCQTDWLKFMRAYRIAGKGRPKQVRRTLARIFAGRA